MRALRVLARDARARAESGTCLLEGPRVIDAALERGAELTGAYFGYGAAPAFPEVSTRLARAGVPVHTLKEGALERIGTTRTPQPVLAVARWAPQRIADLLDGARTGFVVVVVDVADPGNLGTILRSAEAAGAVGLVVAGASVDVRNPKVVRASAGALFGLPVVEAPDTLAVLAGLRAAGVRCVAAIARGGSDPSRTDLAHGCAIVVGNEARGLDAALMAHLDGTVTVAMAGAAESLNVAMAATVLCFEAARQRVQEHG